MYSEAVERLFNTIGQAQTMVLATSANGRVTARMMSFIIQDEMFYFQTDTKFTKYQQIKENPLVGLCLNNIQIEGYCEILGHPSKAQNQFFDKAFKKHYPSSYENYSKLKDEVVIKIIPTAITIWDYDNRPYREFFNMKDQSYYKEYYI